MDVMQDSIDGISALNQLLSRGVPIVLGAVPQDVEVRLEGVLIALRIDHWDWEGGIRWLALRSLGMFLF